MMHKAKHISCLINRPGREKKRLLKLPYYSQLSPSTWSRSTLHTSTVWYSKSFITAKPGPRLKGNIKSTDLFLICMDVLFKVVELTVQVMKIHTGWFSKQLLQGHPAKIFHCRGREFQSVHSSFHYLFPCLHLQAESRLWYLTCLTYIHLFTWATFSLRSNWTWSCLLLN